MVLFCLFPLKGRALDNKFHPLLFQIGFKSYAHLDEEGRRIFLKQAMLQLKMDQRHLYNDLYSHFLALKDNNLHTLIFLDEVNCKSKKVNIPLNHHRCLNLKSNAINKFLQLKKFVKENFFVRLSEVEGGLDKDGKFFVNDLKQRIETFFTIQQMYSNENYKSAQQEIDKIATWLEV